MTTLATNRPMTTAAPGRPTPGASSAAAGPTIDPIRLVKKYKWVLVGAVILGIVVGIGAYIALRALAPRYDAFAIFQVIGQQEDVTKVVTAQEDELERFMLTQTQLMVSDTVLERVVSLNSIQNGTDAPKWAKRFIVNGVFDRKAAKIDLADRVKARVVPGTEFIRLGASFRDKNDVYNLVMRIREEYHFYISEGRFAEMENRINTLRKQLSEGETLITQLTTARTGALGSEGGLDSIDSRLNQARNAVAGINAQLNEVLLGLEGQEATLERFEQDGRNPNGPRFDDSLRDQVEQSPIIMNFKARVAGLETELRAIEAQGFGPAHSEYRRIQSELESQQAQLQEHREDELERVFFAQIQATRNLINQLKLQKIDLESRHDEHMQRLNRVLIIQVQISDYEKQIAEARDRNRNLGDEIERLENLRDASTEQVGVSRRRLYTDRVRVVAREVVPDQLAFPKLVMILPAGVVLVCGFVGSLIILRELVDQRVRGPADLAMLPRTRILGMVPMSDIDPAGRTAVETAFRDRPTGAIAEHFRQIRAPLNKRMEQAGHRALVVASGMPDSGGTTITVNLAFAAAASDQRVLVIDANFRRPSIHKLLNVNEGPGLSDVLANGQGTSLMASVQKAASNIDVLAAGSRNLRIYERLGTEAMAELLAEAKANYNLILVDAPPMVVSGDTLALANRADASLLVVRALSERRGLVNRLRNELGEARGEFLGVIVNGVRPSAGGYLKRNVRATHDYQAAAE